MIELCANEYLNCAKLDLGCRNLLRNRWLEACAAKKGRETWVLQGDNGLALLGGRRGNAHPESAPHGRPSSSGTPLFFCLQGTCSPLFSALPAVKPFAYAHLHPIKEEHR
jgi:hypothetical protein